MSNKYTKITLNGRKTLKYEETNLFYTSVKSITFIPKEKYKAISPAIKQGEKYYWKLFGLIPLIPKTAKTDLYLYVKRGRKVYTSNVIEYFINYFHTESQYLDIDNVVYNKAKIIGCCHDSEYSLIRYFTTDEEAMEYLEYTKKRCRYYNNALT